MESFPFQLCKVVGASPWSIWTLNRITNNSFRMKLKVLSPLKRTPYSGSKSMLFSCHDSESETETKIQIFTHKWLLSFKEREQVLNR